MSETFKELESLRSIVKNSIVARNLTILDFFTYGENKIEFMVMYCKLIISISIDTNLSYDFTVFNESGDKIIYNNTKHKINTNNLPCILLEDFDNLSHINS